MSKHTLMAAAKKPTFHPEDIRLEVLVHGRDKPEFLIHFVRADFINRISESVEHRNMCCVWVAGESEEAPLIVNAIVEDVYVAWVEARRNIYTNQLILSQ